MFKKNTLTTNQIDVLSELLNPLKFINTYCTNSLFMTGLREFQKTILECDDQYVSLRIGRRSGKTHTLALKATSSAIINPNYRVIVITPTQLQSSVLYKMILNRIINPSQVLSKCVTKKRVSPMLIEFSNGSSILFLTAGTRSGRGGEIVRGQGADLVILDEADYLLAADLDAILALRIEHKGVKIWASSTPTGRRGHFYNWCKIDIKERGGSWTTFHYTSPQAIPDWNEETDVWMRKNYTGDAYGREVLAEFGSEMRGVFNKEMIDYGCECGKGWYEHSRTSFPTYGYLQKPDKDAIRTIGVDWDKYQAPTEIVVLEHCGTYNKIVHRSEIARSEYTLDNAVKKIIELNAIWQPTAIYVDRGFGEYQVEVLKKYGIQHPETKLHKRLKAISFGSKTDWFDPFTREIDRKDTKPLMVNLLSKLIEDGKLMLNEHDEETYNQLINYCVEKIGSNGRPIFTSEREHIVDALMLANFALVEKHTDTNYVATNSYYKHLPHQQLKRKACYEKYLSFEDWNTDKVNPLYRERCGENSYNRNLDKNVNTGFMSRSFTTTPQRGFKALV